MPERIEPFEVDHFYHIYNRGVNKQIIYFSERNYTYFLNKMAQYFQSRASILAYCLMPNHFHFLIQVIDLSFLTKGLQPFLLTYAKSINIDQSRTGPLFQGRYQANHIQDDEYLVDCIKYIHLNPVKAHLVDHPLKWPYSSYRDYCSSNQRTFVNTFYILQYFESVANFREYTESNMNQYVSKHFQDFE